MDNSISIDLTENDINFFTVAYQRKMKQEFHATKFNKFMCPYAVESGAPDDLKFTKISLGCYKHGLGAPHNNEFLPVHDVESKILNNDLKTFEEAFLHKCNDESLNEPWPLNQLLCLEKYMDLMHGPLKENLGQMHPVTRLSFIVNLLIDFHCGHECHVFMSIVIKLCLKALELSRYTSLHTSERVHLNFYTYFMMIQRYQCDGQISTYILKKFYVSLKFKKLLLDVQDLRSILEDVLKTGSSIQDFLNHNEPGTIRILDSCLLKNPDNFEAFVELGSYSTYTKEDWEILKSRDQWLYSLENLRTLQVLHLHGLPRHKGEYLLKLLWAVVPEPFLTENELRSSAIYRFAASIPSLVRTERELKLAWVWYKRTILRGNLIKSPRSLAHLSRCAIRQSLAINSQLPKVVQSFDIPKELINYLLLKDCCEIPDDDEW